MIDDFNTKADEVLLIFGGNIKRAREAKKISRKLLAQRAKYDRICLVKLETGIQNIKITTAINLAKALDVSFAALFSRNYMSPLASSEMQIDIGFTEDEHLLVFVENFRRALKEQNREQLRVYLETGTSEASISRIITGKNVNPTLITLNAMAYAAQRDMYALFSRN